MKKIYLLFWVILLVNDIFAINKVGTTSAGFLEIGIGSRASSLGNAFVGLADDVSALYWNPAGISRINNIEMMFSYTNWLSDITLNYGGVVVPLGSFGTIGIAGTFLSMGEMKVRTIDYQEGTGERFDASDLAFALSYGFNLTDRFSFGISMKYIQEKIWHCEAKTMAFDFGTLFRTQFHGLRIGAVIYNFGSAMQMQGLDLLVFHDPDERKTGNNDKIIAYQGTDKWELPLNFQAGIAIDLLNKKYHKITLLADVLHPSDNQESMNLGVEYSLNNLAFLRLGWSSLFQKNTEEGLTFGGGIKKKFGSSYILIDYAYSSFNRFNYTQNFSFSFQF